VDTSIRPGKELIGLSFKPKTAALGQDLRRRVSRRREASFLARDGASADGTAGGSASTV
jgi:hypothetical protein